MPTIDRRYRVVARKNGVTVLDESSVRCKFEVRKTMLCVPHRAKISLQSLDISDRNANMRNADITLYAGDGINGTGIIFSGKVAQSTIEKARDGFSRILSISASDGEDFYNESFVQTSIASGVRIRDLISIIAYASATPLRIGYISPDIGLSRVTRGRVAFGSASDELRHIANSEKAIMWVEEGALYMIVPSDDTFMGNVSIKASDGMIGVPRKRDAYVSADKWLDSCAFLNAKATIDNERDMWGERVLSTGRAFAITHCGDTHDGEWKTTVSVLPLHGNAASGDTADWR